MRRNTWKVQIHSFVFLLSYQNPHWNESFSAEFKKAQIQQTSTQSVGSTLMMYSLPALWPPNSMPYQLCDFLCAHYQLCDQPHPHCKGKAHHPSPSLTPAFSWKRPKCCSLVPKRKIQSRECETSQGAALRSRAQPAPALKLKGQCYGCPAVPRTDQVQTSYRLSHISQQMCLLSQNDSSSWLTWYHYCTLSWIDTWID